MLSNLFNDKYTPISAYREVESNQTFLKKQIDRIFNFQFFAISILKKNLNFYVPNKYLRLFILFSVKFLPFILFIFLSN
jgi:hypothetical protein